MGFRRSVPWASQPQGAPQFAQYWLDRGLQCVTVGQQAWVRGSGGWVSAAPGTVQATQDGQAAHDLVVSNADYQKIAQGAEQSIFALAIPGGNLNGYTTVVAGSLFNDTTRGGIEIGVYDGSHNWYFICRSPTFPANQTLNNTGFFASSGVTAKLCYRSSAIGTPYHSLSVDEGAANVGTTFAAVGTNSTDTMTIGATAAGGGTVAVPLFARFNVALTDAEFASLRRNPWQLFAPQRRSLGGITGTVTPTIKPFRRSVPWTSQPQVAVGAQRGAISNGLAILTTASNPARNAVDGASASVLSGSYSLVPGQSGLEYSGTVASIGFPISLPSNELTLVTVLRANSSIFRLFSAGSNSAQHMLYWDCSNPTYRLYIYNSGAYILLVDSNAYRTSGNVVVLAVVANSSGYTAYANGINVGSTASTPLNFSVINEAGFMYRQGATLFDDNVTGAIAGAAWSRALTPAEIQTYASSPAAVWQLFAPQRRSLGGISGTISRPGTDVSFAGWSFTATSLAGSINEATRDDASYAQAAYGVAGAITTLDLPLVAGSYTLSFAGNYLSSAASSGQFRFTALDGSNTSLGVTAWQAVTSTATQYDIPITVAGGTATRLKIEIQA